jgi:hypothetical protein
VSPKSNFKVHDKSQLCARRLQSLVHECLYLILGAHLHIIIIPILEAEMKLRLRDRRHRLGSHRECFAKLGSHGGV